MLEKILMEMMGLQGYLVQDAQLLQDGIHVWVRPSQRLLTCPVCGQITTAIHSQWEVTLTERSILGQVTHLHVPHYRIRCACQSGPVTLALAVQEPGFMVTRGLARQTVEWAKEIPVKIVARWEGLHWNTARDIDLTHLKERIDAAGQVAPNAIAVDEVAYRSGHRYLTIVTDQQARRVVYVAQGRKKENLVEFFEKRMDPLAAKRLEAASMDMWEPYHTALKEQAPQALVVYDPFHLARMMNDAVDQVRRREQAKLTGEGKSLLKHKRYLLLKGQERLKPEQQQTLKELLEQNEPLNAAHLLKEQFRQLYKIESGDEETPQALCQRAFQFLVGWLERAEASGLTPLTTFAKRVKKHWCGIINYFRYPISNGLAEGLNNKIASLKKRAYGFRNMEYFMLKIYQQGGFI